MFKVFRRLAAATMLVAQFAHAQLTIEITGAGANRIPVAIANFACDGAGLRAGPGRRQGHFTPLIGSAAAAPSRAKTAAIANKNV